MNKKITVIWILVAMALMFAVGCVGNAESVAELLSLGEQFLLESKYEQALVQFMRVIEIEPMNPRGYTGAAQAYIGLGDIEAAIAILQQGLELLPDEVTIIRMLVEELGLEEVLSILDEDVRMLIEELGLEEALAVLTVLTEELGVEETEIASHEPAEQPRYLFTEEQRTILTNLAFAAEQLDLQTVYEIMRSTAFREIFDYLQYNECIKHICFECFKYIHVISGGGSETNVGIHYRINDLYFSMRRYRHRRDMSGYTSYVQAYSFVHRFDHRGSGEGTVFWSKRSYYRADLGLMYIRDYDSFKSYSLN